jgi:hypothetical protein
MAGAISKKYNLDLDYFIVNALDKKNLNYRPLHKLVKDEYRRGISFETFGYHIDWLIKSRLIAKDTKYAPYYLTEKCKQLIRTGTLVFVSPKPKAIEQSASIQSAIKRIHAHILLLLFKSDSHFEFATIEELEHFLSRFGPTSSLDIFRSASNALHISSNETYRLIWVAESEDGKFSVTKRKYLRSPNRKRNGISFICNIKGTKYPIARYRSDPFRNMTFTQDEIKDTILTLVNENILQQPILFSGKSIYLATDIHLYDLLSEYGFLYGIRRSTLKQLWDLREPTSEEKQWLQRIEGYSGVAKSIIQAREQRKKRGLSYYKRQKLIKDLINQTTRTEEGKYLEWTEKKYQDTLSNPKYQFIIDEIQKLVFPNWFKKIKITMSDSQSWI